MKSFSNTKIDFYDVTLFVKWKFWWLSASKRKYSIDTIINAIFDSHTTWKPLKNVSSVFNFPLLFGEKIQILSDIFQKMRLLSDFPTLCVILFPFSNGGIINCKKWVLPLDPVIWEKEVVSWQITWTLMLLAF